MNKNLKVGLVLDDSLDKFDGVQQYVLALGSWLAAQGHDVHYLVGETKRQDLGNLHSLARNVKVRFNKNRMAIPLPANLRKIRELLEREQFDVLHVQVPYSPALAGRVVKAAGPQTAVVGTFHILPHSRFVTLANRALGRAVRGSLKRFDVILSNSTASAKFAQKAYKAIGPVIPLPLQLENFYDTKPFAKYKSGKTVVFLGRLVERKGCQYLLRAVAHARKNSTWPEDARVVVCGAGHLAPSLKKYVATSGIEDIVEFTGFIEESDKPRYLASADVAVYPSTGGESFGIVLLEAMAASPGVVLAGNNPGYACVMAERPESLFEPRDIPAFAEKLVTSLNDQKLKKQANSWQRKYIRQFDVAVVGKQIVDLYKSAIKQRRAAQASGSNQEAVQ